MDKPRCQTCEWMREISGTPMCLQLDRDITHSIQGKNSPRVCPRRHGVSHAKRCKKCGSMLTPDEIIVDNGCEYCEYCENKLTETETGWGETTEAEAVRGTGIDHPLLDRVFKWRKWRLWITIFKKE